ncbi:hypothetical protein DBV15_02968 [Temnothorax longispinosus]|uniref:Uncharacterized protein n=1 Tax=Temnothorax longispinosus TaxID=300112 RepID=A0A4S2JNJ6_9HYME|nr:hypothetical protein DBV15_02968 [Temnothorax longispinosus]
MEKLGNYFDDLGLASAGGNEHTHASVINDWHSEADSTGWWFRRIQFPCDPHVLVVEGPMTREERARVPVLTHTQQQAIESR